MIRCILESPYAAPKDVRDRAYGTAPDSPEWVEVRRYERRNLRYLKALALYALSSGFAPFASHALYTQWLDDHDPTHRQLGIDAGIAWAEGVGVVLVGIDLGVSVGMEYGLAKHRDAGRRIEDVSLPDFDLTVEWRERPC